eukprot:scaffold213101_cov28-Attheya_sp.AAC.1
MLGGWPLVFCFMSDMVWEFVTRPVCPVKSDIFGDDCDCVLDRPILCLCLVPQGEWQVHLSLQWGVSKLKNSVSGNTTQPYPRKGLTRWRMAITSLGLPLAFPTAISQHQIP